MAGWSLFIEKGYLIPYFCCMEFIIKNYKIFLKGLLIMLGIFYLFLEMNVIELNFLAFGGNVLIFVFWWFLISFLIYKNSIYHVLGLVVLLIAVIAVDKYLNLPDNRITFPLSIVFWLGAAYLFFPQFFKKYTIAILAVYGVILYYFFVFRMNSNDFPYYRSHIIDLLVMPMPVMVVLWIYEQWRGVKTLKADKAKAELMLLKSQINPHFLFNTLNNLYGLAVEKSDQAPEVILKLSDMMRYTIYEGKEDFVSLTDEITYLENYIELHKIRYHQKVDIRFTKNISEDYSIAPLLFIILLENAFKHGVERIMEDAYVHINLTAQDQSITFTIENNFEEPTTKKPTGIGLENLRERLAHIYPNRHQLEIHKQAPIYKVLLTIKLS